MGVLFVGGTGRSGSTLVDRIIGQVPGYVSTGEMRTIWLAGLIENRLCGCGEPFRTCPFWSRVGEAAFGGWDTVDPEWAEAELASLTHTHAVRRVLSRSSAAAGADPRLIELLTRLYTGIDAVSDGATIVDSSKDPRYGLVVSSLPGIDFRTIHLVRDSRGVAYSWSKEVMRPDTPGRRVPMLRLGPVGASARWVAHNAFIELLGRRVPIARLRYETFTERPREELVRALGALGHRLTTDDLGFIGDGTVTLAPNHTVMGNPMRMSSGPLPLKADMAWQEQFPRWPRTEVTLLTWPLLRRYGYDL